MKFVRQYLIPRLIQYVLMISLGVTIVFFMPRLLPIDPVMAQIRLMEGLGGGMDPAAQAEMIATLRELYGLEEGLFRQYVSFWRRFFTLDFGPSLSRFPVPVNWVIGIALPWTVGLLLTGTLLGWIIGNILGGLTGYFRRSRLLKIIDGIAMFVRPLPPYVLALMLIILFAFLLGLFPLRGALRVGMEITFTWPVVREVLRHAFLPVMALALMGAADNHQTMRLLVQTVKDEDYVRYAKIGSVKERTIFGRYVVRNALLPQITALSLSLGRIFGGALIIEMVFSFPGLGLLLYEAIMMADYNLIMGISSMSIMLLATSLLLVDLLYPLFDPRIRHK